MTSSFSYAKERQQQILNFVLRRAFRQGAVRRNDIGDAFGLSVSVCSQWLGRAEEDYANVLVRRGHALRPRPLAEVPAQAGIYDLMLGVQQLNLDTADDGAFYRRLGLTREEAPILFETLVETAPLCEKAVWQLWEAQRSKAVVLLEQTPAGALNTGKRYFAVFAFASVAHTLLAVGQDLEREDGALVAIDVASVSSVTLLARSSLPERFAKKVIPWGTPLRNEVLLRVTLNSMAEQPQAELAVHQLGLTQVELTRGGQAKVGYKRMAAWLAPVFMQTMIPPDPERRLVTKVELL